MACSCYSPYRGVCAIYIIICYDSEFPFNWDKRTLFEQKYNLDSLFIIYLSELIFSYVYREFSAVLFFNREAT